MPSPRANVVVEQPSEHDHAIRVVLSGEIDVQTTAPIREQLVEAAESATHGLILDVSGVTFADSSALAAFAATRRVTDERAQPLQIVGATGAVQTVLQMAGMLGMGQMAMAPGHPVVDTAPDGFEPDSIRGHELVFEGDSSAPAVARTAVTRWLGATHPSLDDTLLVVSELVTNVVRHSGSGGELRLEPGPPIRLAIRDRSSEVPTTLSTAGSHGGFGLRLVDELSTAWGVAPEPTGKVVWASMRESAPPGE